MTLDPNARMDQLLRQAVTEHAEFQASVLAAKIIRDLNQTDPDLLRAWLMEIAPSVVATRLTSIDNAARSVARRRQTATRFTRAMTAFKETGQTSSLTDPFATHFVVDMDNTRRRVSEMTGADHQFVAEGYYDSGQQALLLAEFHRAISKKVGNRTTAQAMDQNEYLKLYRSVTGKGLSGESAA